MSQMRGEWYVEWYNLSYLFNSVWENESTETKKSIKDIK